MQTETDEPKCILDTSTLKREEPTWGTFEHRTASTPSASGYKQNRKLLKNKKQGLNANYMICFSQWPGLAILKLFYGYCRTE